MLQFKLVLPAVPAEPADIVGGKLSYKIGDAELVSADTAKDQVEVAGLEGADGAEVVGLYAFVDDAGNVGEANPFSFVLADTIPPPAPGEVGLVVTGEV